jgi:hypothetical protein
VHLPEYQPEPGRSAGEPAAGEPVAGWPSALGHLHDEDVRGLAGREAHVLAHDLECVALGEFEVADGRRTFDLDQVGLPAGADRKVDLPACLQLERPDGGVLMDLHGGVAVWP